MDKINYIKEIMKLKGVSIAELSLKLGVSQRAVTDYMVHDFKISKLKAIADALGVSIPELFIKPQYADGNDQKEKSHVSVTCPHCKKPLNISISPKIR